MNNLSQDFTFVFLIDSWVASLRARVSTTVKWAAAPFILADKVSAVPSGMGESHSPPPWSWWRWVWRAWLSEITIQQEKQHTPPQQPFLLNAWSYPPRYLYSIRFQLSTLFQVLWKLQKFIKFYNGQMLKSFKKLNSIWKWFQYTEAFIHYFYSHLTNRQNDRKWLI